MIATLEGTVSENNADYIVLDVGGVGYGVFVAGEDHSVLQTGTKTKLYIYEHIREVAHDLFGFVLPESKKLFEQLLSVNGVGPKMALSILNLGSSKNVASSIANQDAEYIKQASGVGKKVAERIVLDLKDKVGIAGSFVGATQSTSDEAVQGLIALGYTLPDAQNALAEINPKLPTADRIKQALKGKS